MNRRSRLKFILFAAAPTLVLLLLVELTLHWVGIPYEPDSLLRPHFVTAGDGEIETDSFLDLLVAVDSDGNKSDAGAHYQKFPLRKAPGVFRVAILGGSSVKLLEDLNPLQEALVNAGIAEQVEILNFGVCGCGSDRALASAPQALELDVDVILLFSGHNEFISESNYKTYRSTGWLHRHSKLFQLCFGTAWIPEPGKFYTDREKDAVYEQFRQNLTQLSAICRQADVPLIWGSVASNLIFPPAPYVFPCYASFDLPPEPAMQFKRGLKLIEQERYEEAKQTLQEAIASSPRPWRATWRTNQILRETAAELSVPLADVEQRVDSLSPHGIPGFELFSDLCHLKPDSDKIIMETFAEVLIRQFRPATD